MRQRRLGLPTMQSLRAQAAQSLNFVSVRDLVAVLKRLTAVTKKSKYGDKSQTQDQVTWCQ